MSTRQTPVCVFVDLTRCGHDERAKEGILDSIRASDAAIDSTSVWVALDDANDSVAKTVPDPSWAVYSNRAPAQVANLAFAGAARMGADLLILDGSNIPDTSSLHALGRCLETDPHIGFAAPRVEGFKRHLIRKVDPELGDPDIDLIPRSVIDSQPPHYLMRDFANPCLLCRAKLVREFQQLDLGFETLRGAIRELMARARRVGFRSAVVNLAFVEYEGEHTRPVDAGANARDLARLYELYPEQGQVDENQRRLSLHEHESLLGRAASASPALKQSLIIDASEMGEFHNGTAESILGILKGLHGLARGWKITILVPPAGARYHELERLFPSFEFVWPDPPRRYTAALRLFQPWSIQILLRLHRLALFNFVFMHDTILDDIGMDAPIGLEHAWAFAARNIDGLLYNSQYTRDRMRQRFAIAASVEERVSHLSMDPIDYCAGIPEQKPENEDEPYVYVVGNHFPHKWMDATVQDLARAFPFLKLKTLGYQNPSITQLEGFASGNLRAQQVDGLYAGAGAIVLPSVYEGFGFPLIKSLSHGRTVVARRSELLDELAGMYRGPGQLVQFSSSQELIEQVGRILHGLPVDTIALGTSLGPSDSPPSWPDVAGRILDLIIERAEKPGSSNWLRRETEFAAIQAFAASS